jgi:hypothetical protein
MGADSTPGSESLLGDDRGRGLAQPSELGVAVGEACTRLATLVQKRVYVRETVLAGDARSLPPRRRNAVDL